MSEHQLHLEQDFFDNPNQQEFSYLPPTHDDPHPQNKSYPPHSAPPHATPQDLEPTAGSNRFYQEYRRIFSVAYNIQAEKERLADVLRDLNERIRAMENKLQGNESRGRQSRPVQSRNELYSEQSRNKRARRTAEQIEKKFKCEVAFCERFYGSEGSLQQHIKLKHSRLLHHDSSDEYRPNVRDKFDHSQN